MTRRSPTVGRTVRWAVLLTSVVVLLMSVPVTSASAHAFLVDSDPADGAVLAVAPTQIHLSFSESVVLEAFSLDIVGASGRHYRPTGSHLLEAADPTGAAGNRGRGPTPAGPGRLPHGMADLVQR